MGYICGLDKCFTCLLTPFISHISTQGMPLGLVQHLGEGQRLLGTGQIQARINKGDSNQGVGMG